MAGDQRAAARSAPQGRRRSGLRARLPHPAARDRRDDAGGRDPVPRGRRDCAGDRGVPARARGRANRRELVANSAGHAVDLPPAAGRRQPRPAAPAGRELRGARGRLPPRRLPGRRGPALGARRRRRLAAARPLAAGRDGRGDADPHSATRSGRTGGTASWRYSAVATSSCQRSTCASGGSAARGLVLEALGRGGDLLRRQEVDRREVPGAQLLGRVLAGHRAVLLEPAQRTSPKPASASSRVERLGVGKRARSIAGRSGRYGRRWCPVKCSGANVQMNRRPSGRARAAPRPARAPGARRACARRGAS